MFDTSSNLFGGGTNPSMYGINPFQQQFGMSNTSQNSMIDTTSSDFDIDELVNVIMGAFPLQEVVMMFTEDDLA